jgi:hypothetical protein
MSAQTYEAVVPARLIGQHPDDGSTMVDVVFSWTPGLSPGARTMSNPMGTDDGAPDEFAVVSPCGLSCDQDDAVVEWLDANWERPVDYDRDDEQDAPIDRCHRKLRAAEGREERP